MNKSHPVAIMPCLDIARGRVVKGVQFEDIRDAGDPVESCLAYCRAGADELALLDITATIEGRGTLLDVVHQAAQVATIPLTVGGGIRNTADAETVLQAGAAKVSVSSAAFRSQQEIPEMVRAFGSERITVAIDAGSNPRMPSGYEVFIDGGRTATGCDAIEWAKKVADFGAGTILPTSKVTDGVRTGYDLPLIRAISKATGARVVASGGAGTLEHFKEAVEAGAAVLLAASVFHFQIISIPQLKQYLREHKIISAS